MSIAFNSVPLFIDGFTQDDDLLFQSLLRSSFDTYRKTYFSISKLFNNINKNDTFTNEQKKQIAFEISKAEYILGNFPFTIYPLKGENVPFWTDKTPYNMNILYNELVSKNTTEEKLDYLKKNGFRYLDVFEEIFYTLSDNIKPNLLDFVVHYQSSYPNYYKIYLEHINEIFEYEGQNSFTTNQLLQVLSGFEKGFNKDQMFILSNVEFDDMKMHAILEWIDSLGINDELLFALDNDYHHYQIEAINRCLCNNVSYDNIEILRNKTLSESMIKCICKAFISDNLSSENIRLLLEPSYNEKQREQIELALAQGLDRQYIDFMANSNLSSEQMMCIRKGFVNGLSMEQVIFYASPDINYAIMDEIRKGFENGLSVEQVMLYARDDIPIATMKNIRYCLQNGYESDEFLENMYVMTPSQLCHICIGIDSGLTNEQINTYATKERDYSMVLPIINKYKEYNASLIEIKNNMKFKG